MDITDDSAGRAAARMKAKRAQAHAISAVYDRQTGRVMVRLHSGDSLSISPAEVEGLNEASPDDLTRIEISPSGLGLHWPDLDVDLYIPGLIAGKLGTQRWTARQEGRS